MYDPKSLKAEEFIDHEEILGIPLPMQTNTKTTSP